MSAWMVHIETYNNFSSTIARCCVRSIEIHQTSHQSFAEMCMVLSGAAVYSSQINVMLHSHIAAVGAVVDVARASDWNACCMQTDATTRKHSCNSMRACLAES